MGKIEWLSLSQIMLDEIFQSYQEGKDIKIVEIKQSLKQFLAENEGKQKEEKLKSLYEEIINSKVRKDYGYYEPNDYVKIKNNSSENVFNNKLNPILLEDDELFDHIYGGWLGRCAGCLLGKPVEGMSFEQIKELNKWKNNWPIEYYISKKNGLPTNFNMDEEQVKRYKTGVFENVLEKNSMLRDDDIDYTIIGLRVLERYGKEFTSIDIGMTWLEYLPLFLTYTAERVAYKNLINGINPPETAFYYNPYREWIGAQIRSDIWGYVNPDNLEKATEFAYRDAIISHQKNGIYGELFVSAAIAASFGTSDISTIIKLALSRVPVKSRLYETIKNVMKWSKNNSDWRDTFQCIREKYSDYNWFHVIPNAAIVVMALIYGEGDFSKSITIAVMAGLDTDCNGATVGSILGIITGASRLPSKWINPMNDQVSSALIGMTELNVSDLATRTLSIIKNKGG